MLNFIAIYSRTGAGISHQNLKIFAEMERFSYRMKIRKEIREQKILKIILTFYGITGKKQVFFLMKKYENIVML